MSWPSRPDKPQPSPTVEPANLGRSDSRSGRARGRVFGIIICVLSALALALMWPHPAAAADLSATQMRVSVWPEYDDPRVLVIHEASLDPSVQLPAEVSFNIPKQVEVGMACEVDRGGGHACKGYGLVDQGDYQTLTYWVESQHTIFLEYYYVAFASGDPDRSFDFTFRPSFFVKSLDLEVQEPLRSTGFSLEPTLPQTSRDSQGIAYHRQSYTDVSVDQPLKVTVSYTKTDNAPSLAMASNIAGDPKATLGSSTDWGNIAAYLLLGVSAFAGLVIFSYKKLRPAPSGVEHSERPSVGTTYSGQQPRPDQDVVAESKGSGRPRGPKTAASEGQRAVKKNVKHCSDCGSREALRHRFCPHCGSEQP